MWKIYTLASNTGVLEVESIVYKTIGLKVIVYNDIIKNVDLEVVEAEGLKWQYLN